MTIQDHFDGMFMNSGKVLRVNVTSGRPIEEKAKFSRAIRINDLILQSGTTAIDTQGNILGVNVAEQVEAILSIAENSMTAAGGCLQNTYRARIYVKGEENIIEAEKALTTNLNPKGKSLVITTFEISGLTRPQQLVEIEFEGLANDVIHKFEGDNYKHHPASGALKLGSRIFVPGYAAKGNNLNEQLSDANIFLSHALSHFGLGNEHIVCLKLYSASIEDFWTAPGKVAQMLSVQNPTISLIGIPTKNTLIIEAEATTENTSDKKKIIHPTLAPFSESISIDQDIYLSTIYPTNSPGNVLEPGNWSEQRNICTENLQVVLKKVDSNLDDIVVRRYLTLSSVSETTYESGPAWFEATRPTALGCRVPLHPIRDASISLDCHAMRGAGNNIIQKSISG